MGGCEDNGLFLLSSVERKTGSGRDKKIGSQAAREDAKKQQILPPERLASLRHRKTFCGGLPSPSPKPIVSGLTLRRAPAKEMKLKGIGIP